MQNWELNKLALEYYFTLEVIKRHLFSFESLYHSSLEKSNNETFKKACIVQEAGTYKDMYSDRFTQTFFWDLLSHMWNFSLFISDINTKYYSNEIPFVLDDS